jgi:phosphoglycerate dehydrogenase-like enzyme
VTGDRANLLIAVPTEAERLAAIRAAMPHCAFDCIDPFPRDTMLPVEIIHDRTILFADFAPANLLSMARLEWMQLGSAGYMQLEGLPLETMGVRVTNASGVNDVPIAEWSLMMMLTFERALPKMLRLQHERGWDRRAQFQAELRGRRVGIVGYGNIGREVARVCRALGLEIWAMNRTPVGPTPLKFAPAGTGDPQGELPHRCFTLDQMEQFLPHLDYLVTTAALNPRTRGLLGERELRLLSPQAVILNPARAHLIDEAALHRALREGWIAGAALDSHYREPLAPDDPTWDLPNVVLTPHISGSTLSPHYLSRLWELFARNLERYITDQPLLNEVSWTELNAG